jgi:hypothetical protein
VVIYGADVRGHGSAEQVDLYGLEIKGQWPARVEYGMAGVGEEGAVLMQPDADGHGRVVTAVLPKTRSPAFAPRSGACSCRLQAP